MAGLKWYGPKVMAAINAAGARGVGDGIDMIMETSQDRVPVMTRDLKNSKKTEKNGLQAVGGYTDSKAAAAHENVHGHVYRNGKVPKFLESAARDRRDDVIDAIAAEIRKVLL